MKKLFLSMVLVLAGMVIRAQEQPVSWSFDAKKIGDKTYEIRLTAKIEDDWHIYSQTTPDGGPVPTSISYAKNPLVTMEGGTKEVGKMEKHFEKLFGVEVLQFSNKVDFVQTVKLKANVKTNITGSVTFMVCNDEMCMPPTSVKFNLPLK